MTQQTQKLEQVNMLNYLTISSLAYNLYLFNSGNNKFQQAEENINFNRSRIEHQFLHFIQDEANLETANKIIRDNNKNITTDFNFITVTNTNMKYDNYNIDIVAKTDQGSYLIEIDGEFYHGLIDLPDNHKYYQLMIERRTQHEKK